MGEVEKRLQGLTKNMDPLQRKQVEHHTLISSMSVVQTTTTNALHVMIDTTNKICQQIDKCETLEDVRKTTDQLRAIVKREE